MSARADIVPVFVPHLGCPHACVFCNQRHITGQLSSATAQSVEEAIRSADVLPRSAEPRQLAFYGGSFTAIPAEQQVELLSAAKRAIDRGDIDRIRISTRPDAIDEEVLARLRQYGVHTIELGAQSLNDEVLSRSRRGHTAQDVKAASEEIREAGFNLILQMMTGLPGDTPDRCVETARQIVSLRPDGVRIYPTVIVKDTELYDLWKSGQYQEHTVEEAVSICAKLVPLFEKAGIPIIRLGLNPTEELSSGSAVAGAYHPAFGELVKSRILLNKARVLLENVQPGSVVTLGIAPQLLSQMIGQKGINRETLWREFSLSRLNIVSADADCTEPQLLFHEADLITYPL